MHQARVSVVLPAYNAAAYVATAIDSVLRQTFPDFELIVLDNASVDATADIVARFDDPRLRFVRNDANVGMVGNINKGLELATGQLGVVLCADDHWHPEFLQRSIARQREEPGLTFTNSRVLSQGRETVFANVHAGRAEVAPWRLVRHLHGIPLSSLVFPLAQSGVRFDARLPFNCDLEFVLRTLLRDARRLTYIDWPGVYVNLHDANETLRYDIRRENAKLLDIVSGYARNPLLRVLIAFQKARLHRG